MAVKSDKLSTVAAQRFSGGSLILQTPASQNTPSSYVQLVAATTGPVGSVHWTFTIDSGFAATLRIEFSTGGAGAEVVKHAVLIDGDVSAQFTGIIQAAIDAGKFPAGSRIAMRTTNISNNSVLTLRMAAYFGETA